MVGIKDKILVNYDTIVEKEAELWEMLNEINSRRCTVSFVTSKGNQVESIRELANELYEIGNEFYSMVNKTKDIAEKLRSVFQEAEDNLICQVRR